MEKRERESESDEENAVREYTEKSMRNADDALKRASSVGVAIFGQLLTLGAITVAAHVGRHHIVRPQKRELVARKR